MTVLAGNPDVKIRFSRTARKSDRFHEWRCGRKVPLKTGIFFPVCHDTDGGLSLHARYGEAQSQLAAGDAETDGGVAVRVARGADLLDRIPILAPRFRLARLEEAEVRLVVGIDTGHDF